MELEVYWTAFAKNELQNIFGYYKEKASPAITRKLISEIVHETKRLQTKSYIGQIEQLLIGQEQAFRYLVYKNYKIIYWINENKSRIEITDVFDTRQNPLKIIKQAE